MKDETISESEVLSFFKEAGGMHKNGNDVELALWEREGLYSISSTTAIKKDDGSVRCIHIELETEHSNLTDFINDFGLSEIEDIEQISSGYLLDLYILGEADGTVTCFLEKYITSVKDVTLSFRRWQNKTCVFSEELNFYDETEAELYEADHFLQYIEQHHQVLQWFADNRAIICSQFPQVKFHASQRE